MNVVSSRPSRLGRGHVGDESSKRSSVVSFYSEVPSFELSLDEFEEYALSRLKVKPVLFGISRMCSSFTDLKSITTGSTKDRGTQGSQH